MSYIDKRIEEYKVNFDRKIQDNIKIIEDDLKNNTKMVKKENLKNSNRISQNQSNNQYNSHSTYLNYVSGTNSKIINNEKEKKKSESVIKIY